MNDEIYNQEGVPEYLRDFLKAFNEAYSWLKDIIDEARRMERAGGEVTEFTVRYNKINREKLALLAKACEDCPACGTGTHSRTKKEVQDVTEGLNNFLNKVNDIMAGKA